jgi:glucokinase
MKYIMGIDVGGTTVKIGQFSETLELVHKWEIHTDKKNQGLEIIEDIISSIKKHVALEDVIGYGFGVPGPVKDGVVIECVNIGWPKEYHLADICKTLAGNDAVYVENDANVATLGEIAKGSAKHYHSAVMLTLGTGIGGGVVIDNQVVSGANGASGEFGHIQIEREHGFACNCGNTGCLETLASASGIKRLFHHYKETTTLQTKLTSNDPSAKIIMNAAVENDELALYTINQVASYLAYAAHMISLSVNPEVIIFGGGVSKAGDFLLDKVRALFKKYPFKATKDTKFLLASLGNDAGMVGAAGLVKNNG